MDRFKLTIPQVLDYSLREIVYLSRYTQREEIFEYYKLMATSGFATEPDKWLRDRLYEWEQVDEEELSMDNTKAEQLANNILRNIHGN